MRRQSSRPRRRQHLVLVLLLGALSSPAAAGAVAPVSLQRLTLPDHFMVDLFGWEDGAGQARSVALVPNTQQDPAGHLGGYAHEIVYRQDGRLRINTGVTPEHPGHGMLVNHFVHDDGSFDSTSSLDAPGPRQTETLLKGPHHAIHQFRWIYEIRGCPVASTVQWFIASGIDHPRWAVTQDSSLSHPDCVKADARGPYGDIDWDGNAGSEVAGVEWGTTTRFVSQCKRRLGFDCPWDNTAANTIPFVMVYSTQADAEAGFVLTQSIAQSGAGGYAFYKQAGTRSTTGPMPPAWAWPYQTLQYQLDEDPAASNPYAKRLAWGTNYGAVGASSYPSFDHSRSLSGRQLSYTGHIVLGTHSGHSVERAVAAEENNQHARLVALQGVQVATQGAAGIARTDVAAYEPAGYNPVYGVWELASLSPTGPHVWSLTAPSGTLQRPIFLLTGRAEEPPLRLSRGRQPLLAGRDYLTTYDHARQALWITILGDIAAADGEVAFTAQFGS